MKQLHSTVKAVSSDGNFLKIFTHFSQPCQLKHLKDDKIFLNVTQRVNLFVFGRLCLCCFMFLMVPLSQTRLYSSSHQCMFLTNVAPFQRGISSLSDGIRFIRMKRCYNKEMSAKFKWSEHMCSPWTCQKTAQLKQTPSEFPCFKSSVSRPDSITTHSCCPSTTFVIISSTLWRTVLQLKQIRSIPTQRFSVNLMTTSFFSPSV